MANYTTVQVGTYFSATDTFSLVLDLNDRASYFVRPQGLKLDQPEKVYARAFNLRTPGETISKVQYKNRHVQVEINLRATTTTTLIAAARALVQAIEHPPYVLRLQPAGGSNYSYADVVAVKHTIPFDNQEILAGAVLKVAIDFECAPGFRGDRIWLQNRVSNPGFEQPASAGVPVFSDTFANANAYTVVSTATSSYDAQILVDGPQRWWKMTEASGSVATDSSSNATNGTYSAVTLGAGGPISGSTETAATYTGGATSYMDAGSGVTNGYTALSVECWFYQASSGSSGNPRLVANGHTDVDFKGFQLYVEGTGGVWFTVSNTGSAASTAKWTGTVTANTWYHVVGTWDGTTVRVYVNAVVGGTTPGLTGTIGTTTYDIRCAQDPAYSSSDLYAGRLGQVAVYSVALTATQISNHYTLGTGGSVATTTYSRGVNESGGEFGSNLPGTYNVDYHYDGSASETYLAGRGHKIIRVPFKWERIQPTLLSALDTTELGRIQTMVSNIQAAGMRAVLDVHNFCEYYTGGTLHVMGDGFLTQTHLTDLWTRLSVAFKGNTGVYAYDLMNEPHDLPATVGTFTSSATIYNFDGTIQGWVSAGTTATLTEVASPVHDGTGALQVSGTLNQAYLRTSDNNGNGGLAEGSNPALAYWIYIPSAGNPSGATYTAHVELYDSTYTPHSGNDISVPTNTWTQIAGTFSNTIWTGHKNIGMQVNVLNFTGTPTLTFVMDTVQQGTLTGSVSGAAAWQQYSQAALNAVRANTDTTLIMVEGYGYAGAQNWTTNHPTPWITDTSNNFLYSAHYYFDTGNSGSYSETYSQTNTDAINAGYSGGLPQRAQTELNVFLNWLSANGGLRGYIGEIGWRNDESTSSWNAVGNTLYSLLDTAKCDATYWSAGEWWGTTYKLSPYTTGGGASLSTTAPPSTVIEAHPTATTSSAGGPVTVAANQMTIPAGTTIQFGSPAWGPVQTWQIRFQMAAGGTINARPHGAVGSATNALEVALNTGYWIMKHIINGTSNTLAGATISLANGTWYWMQITQFPAYGGVGGEIPQLMAVLLNDATGAPGTTISTLGPAPCTDSVTDIVGAASIDAEGAALIIGGNYAGVNQYALFGPGAWTFKSNGDGTYTGAASGAWDNNNSNTLNSTFSAPWTSVYGARIDFGPSGTVQGEWATYEGGGTPAYAAAIPVAVGNTQSVAFWYRSRGLSGTGTVSAQALEYDANGNLIRTGASWSGPDTASLWAQETLTWVIGTGTAYVGLKLRTQDATAGASAGATVWFDNVQCWDATVTKQATMPYCDLRSPMAPAQLQISGVVGDMPAPAALIVGSTPQLAGGGSLTLVLGRRAKAGWKGRLVGAMDVPTTVAAVDYTQLSTSGWGGTLVEFRGGAANNIGMAIKGNLFDLLGQYHIMVRGQVLDSTPTTMQLQWLMYMLRNATNYVGTAPSVGGTLLGESLGPVMTPFPDNTGMHVMDLGLAQASPYPLASLADSSQLQLSVGIFGFNEVTGLSLDWLAMMPIDAETHSIKFLNSGGYSTLIDWIYLYLDGQTAPGSATWSSEVAVPNPIQSGGGYASPTQYEQSVISTGDSVPMVDPSVVSAYSPTGPNFTGVNQYVAVLYDNTNTCQQIMMDVVYSPRYLWPR